jgi:hypothetical protein
VGRRAKFFFHGVHEGGRGDNHHRFVYSPSNLIDADNVKWGASLARRAVGANACGSERD